MTAHVVDRLRAVVDARPGAVAIATAGEPAFTYGELWRRACAIADRLAGVHVVAICMEKSPEFVAAMIGTWIAGAAWVPILPELPEARRTAILDEVGAMHAIVATDRPPDDLVVIDARQGEAEVLRVARSIADRAYIIYTSGSTGRPKGVVVPHRGIVPLVDAQIAAFDLRAGDRCLWMLSPSFDASVSDVFTALLAGATLHIEHPARLRTAAGLVEVLRQRAITHVDMPPSFLPLLPVDAALPELRTIVIGGEVCAPSAVRAWASRVRVVNVYGPTETTVCSTLCVCDPAWSRPLLGRPLPGTELRVVDDELWIGGVGVADGYVASPELEARKFVTVEGRRWFRTGDRVRQHAGGELEIVGRIDRQLKVRGVLVAPEEIEARLREHPAIVDAVVVAERQGLRDVLVAYCVTRPTSVTPRELRADLAASLDRRLVPRRIVFVESLPRTATGKIDATALPASRIVALRGDGLPFSRTYVRGDVPSTHGGTYVSTRGMAKSLQNLAAGMDLGVAARGGSSQPDYDVASAGLISPIASSVASTRVVNSPISREPVVAPTDSTSPCGTSGRLLGVWRELFGDDVGPDDHFFDLGGDSFDVIELLAMAELAGIGLAAEDVYDAPVLADLARRADEVDRSIARSCAELVADAGSLAPSKSTAVGAHGDGTISSRSTPVDEGARGERERRILLPGASGFLGSHVLRELLVLGDATITCLVRATDDTSARARAIAARARVHDGDAVRDAFESRVRCIAGDIGVARFGIGDRWEPGKGDARRTFAQRADGIDVRWEELASDVDTIVHCAAEVSVVAPYAQLRAANVEGTAHVLELATTGRPKRVHYASTLSVFVGGERVGLIAEDDPLESAGRLHGGYAQSKWAAEWLVRAAPDTSIYRFGLLTGDTRDGRGTERDWLTWVVRGIAGVGAYPEIADARVDITPIDYASRAMARMVLDDAHGTYHVANPRSVTLHDIVAAIRRAGRRVDAVSPEQFADVVAPRRDAFAALLGACRAGAGYRRLRGCDMFQASGMTFDTRRTEAVAGACPEATAELLDLYVTRMLA